MHSWLRGILLCWSCLLGVAVAQDSCDDAPLRQQMQSMKTAFKALNQASQTANWAVLAEQTAQLQQQAQRARGQTPAKAWTVDSSPVPMIEAYQTGIDQFLQMLVQLQTAIDNQQIDDVNQLTQRISDHQKRSHRQFKLACD